MKNKFTLILVLIATSAIGWAQSAKMMYLRDRAENNIRYLTNEMVIRNRVSIDQKGIHVSDQNGKVEYKIHWTELPDVVRWMENTDYYELNKFFETKKTQHLVGVKTPTEFNYYKEYPSEWRGLRVMIDPGHFGGEFEKKFEHREVKIQGSLVDQPKDIEFDEADLNYYTALLIREKLIAKGVDEYDITLTRSFDKSAMGVDYITWLNTKVEADINDALIKGDLTAQEMHDLRNQLPKARSNMKDMSSQGGLFRFYRFLDFRARVHAINRNYPHITFVIHYNASDNARPNPVTGYVPTTDANYSMAFVPGAFLRDELSRTDHKVDFMRLLVSPDLDNSMRLASYFIDALKEKTGVMPIPHEYLGDAISRSVIQTDYPGVYSRNLPLTRMIRGAVVYGESMYMNNLAEAVAFTKKDILTTDWSRKEMWVPKRCEQVADAYVASVEKYLEANRAIKIKLFGTSTAFVPSIETQR